ncbi:PC-esterase domain-containing protein 1A [Liparis tanakae]|uniref:PC-esterase domain-containing protein 1A n=1 Tax=Liparis tanakae TaxID=230148 RepID=A0A4Z2GBN9_9TELE|nr:PC-esterase domain-containing protein 1A [Liparis tanakae]
MSARLMRLRQPGPGGVRERDVEDTTQELEARVASLESQKEFLQSKLSLARQHVLQLGARTPYRARRGERATVLLLHLRPHTVCGRRPGVTEQPRPAELELTAQTLRDTLREKEKEMEGTVRDMRRQQADRHRITIRENVDLIRLQKQLSDKSTALRVTQEKFNSLQEAYENQLEEVEELSDQLKQERQRALELEGRLTTTTLSLHTLDKLQESLSDLEGERDLIKENYDALLESTLSVQTSHNGEVERRREVSHRREEPGDHTGRMDIQRLEDMLQAERAARGRLELEKETLRREKETLEERRERGRDEREHLELQAFQYRKQISALQDRLDSVTKEFDMSVEELSETLIQIKAFRMQQESRAGLGFLPADGAVEDSSRELLNVQASHAETILELQKTRNLLLLEHHISKDLQQSQLLEPRETRAVQKGTKALPRPPAVKQKSSQNKRADQWTKRSTKRSPDLERDTPRLTPEPRLATPSRLPTRKSSPTTLSRSSSASDARTQELPSADQVSIDEEEEDEEEERSESAAAGVGEVPESSESSSSQSDIVVIPPQRKMRKGNKLRVEILCLSFEPSSRVALDKSVQRVYVEYRLLGVPMETTETPMSLRKPTKGEEVHYNFTRGELIYVDGSQSAPLRQHLYTMLEGTDPNQGRLKFTVVSEPMDDDEECVDVGHAFLDLQELLLTGDDVSDQQINVLSVDEDEEVIGNLKVSLEAAKALTGIYQEFHQRSETKKEDDTDEEEEKEEKEEQELKEKEEEKKDGEPCFEQDCLVEGGSLGTLTNGTGYREVRQFKSDHHLVRFYFVTRVYSPYMRSILEDFRNGLKPDVIIFNSCVWDISRYDSSWLENYRENLHTFFSELRGILPQETLAIWNLTMPLGETIKGGFMVPEIAHTAAHLRYDVIEANFFSGTLAGAYGLDVLDLHFQFRFSLQHRARDGVHWNALAHRKITTLLLEHSAEAWGVELPLTVVEQSPDTSLLLAIENTKPAERRPLRRNPRVDFPHDSQPVSLLNNPLPRAYRLPPHLLRNGKCLNYRCIRGSPLAIGRVSDAVFVI